MAIKGGRTSGSGGPGSAAITNDDAWTYEAPDDGVADADATSYDKTKDPRSF